MSYSLSYEKRNLLIYTCPGLLFLFTILSVLATVKLYLIFSSLSCSAAAASAAPRATAADPDPAADSPLGMGQPVRPALAPPAYVEQIARSRGPAFDELRQLAADGEYSRLSYALFLGPFYELQQARTTTNMHQHSTPVSRNSESQVFGST